MILSRTHRLLWAFLALWIFAIAAPTAFGQEMTRFELEERVQEEALPFFSLKNDLPGVYVLTALFSDELRLTESELSVLRERGIPLTLTIRDDGAVSLLIFDMQTELRADFDAMFFLADGHPYPFFFQNGSLTVWDSGSRAVFEKII